MGVGNRGIQHTFPCCAKLKSRYRCTLAAFASFTIPEIQKTCGFDLEVGDWLAPYGKGKVADFYYDFEA